jgi:predicted Zn-dependent protease
MLDALDIQVLLVKDLIKAGRLEEAFREFNALLARHADNGRVQALYGKMLFRYFSRIEEAEEAFRKAMRTEGSDVELYLDFAALLLQAGKYTDMVPVLNRALEIPLISKEEIFALFGQLYERQRNWDEAVEYYSRAALHTLSAESMEHYLADRARVMKKRAFLIVDYNG